MELFIIRHGQSENNALEDVTQRSEDPLLTDIGEEQIQQLAPFVAKGGHLGIDERQEGRPFIDELFCSPMWRCLRTAYPISQVLSLKPVVWVDIHEQGGIFLDHGNDRGVVGYSGQTRGQIREQFPEYVLPDEVGEDGWWKGDCEDISACQGRAIGVANDLLERADRLQRADELHRADNLQLDQLEAPRQVVEPTGPANGSRRVAIVSHGGFIDALMKAFGHQLPGNGLSYPHDNTAITRIDLPGNGVVKVRYVNRVTHLPDELVT